MSLPMYTYVVVNGKKVFKYSPLFFFAFTNIKSLHRLFDFYTLTQTYICIHLHTWVRQIPFSFFFWKML